MSVLVECYSVIVRRSAIEDGYPGGLAGYENECPTRRTFCADQHLVRVGFMWERDIAFFLLRNLSRAGLASSSTGRHLEVEFRYDSVAIVEQQRGPWNPKSSRWLEYTARPDGVCHCWLAGQPPGDLASPSGWLPEHSRDFVKLTGIG